MDLDGSADSYETHTYTNELAATMRYVTPATISEALAIRATDDWQIVAGGTDVYPANVGAPPLANVLDISRIEGMSDIVETPAQWRIGASTTWTQLLQAELPPAYRSCRRAA